MSTTTITWDTEDWARVQQALAHLPERLTLEMRQAMQESVDGLLREISDRTPMSGASVHLAGSFTGVTHLDGPLGVVGVIGTVFPYAEWVELGTKPHPVSIKGQQALADWAQGKFSVSEKEARNIAFLVARNIRRKGTKGAFMLRDSLAVSLPKIHENFSAALQRAVAAMGEVG